MGADVLNVVIAAEDGELRDCMAQIVQREPGVRVVGQAQNAIETLAAVKTLRPALALVDSRLPYRIGLDGLPLSRMSGLDAAMTIVAESPGVTAVVLSNPDAGALQGWPAAGTVGLVNYSGGAHISADLRELLAERTSAREVVFADLWVRDEAPPRGKALEVSDNLIVWGGHALVGGLLSMITIIGLVPGVLLAASGVATLLAGCLVRAWAKWGPKKSPASTRKHSFKWRAIAGGEE